MKLLGTPSLIAPRRTPMKRNLENGEISFGGVDQNDRGPRSLAVLERSSRPSRKNVDNFLSPSSCQGGWYRAVRVGVIPFPIRLVLVVAVFFRNCQKVEPIACSTCQARWALTETRSTLHSSPLNTGQASELCSEEGQREGV